MIYESGTPTISVHLYLGFIPDQYERRDTAALVINMCTARDIPEDLLPHRVNSGNRPLYILGVANMMLGHKSTG